MTVQVAVAVGHGFVEVGEFIRAQGGPGQGELADGPHFAIEALSSGLDALVVQADCTGITGMNVHGGGNGVLVGGQEEELPALPALGGDEVTDVASTDGHSFS